MTCDQRAKLELLNLNRNLDCILEYRLDSYRAYSGRSISQNRILFLDPRICPTRLKRLASHESDRDDVTYLGLLRDGGLEDINHNKIVGLRVQRTGDRNGRRGKKYRRSETCASSSREFISAKDRGFSEFARLRRGSRSPLAGWLAGWMDAPSRIDAGRQAAPRCRATRRPDCRLPIGRGAREIARARRGG